MQWPVKILEKKSLFKSIEAKQNDGYPTLLFYAPEMHHLAEEIRSCSGKNPVLLGWEWGSTVSTMAIK